MTITTLNHTDELFPVPSWYKPNIKFSQSQLDYINLLEKGFNMKDPFGNPIPYNMTGYQKEFHAKSFNILLKDSKHILFDKARGVSFTYSSLVELIMTAADETFQQQLIPIITHREKNSIEILNHCKWLITNCNIKEIKKYAKFTEASTEIYFTNTKSKIQVFPSGDAADAIRGNRLLRGLIDEYAFQRNQKKLWAAAKSTMRSGVGQWIIGSTPNGKNNQYNKFVEQSKMGNTTFYYFYLPVFNPAKFDVTKPIPEQNLLPIAPWIDLGELEDDRQSDKNIFLQENMCDPLDKATTLIKYNDILGVCKKNLRNHRDNWLNDPTYDYYTTNPIHAVIDVAKAKDFFAVSAFEEITTSKGVFYVQRWLDYFTNKTTPELEEYTRKFIGVFPSMKTLRIDKTGIGEYLPEYLKKDYGEMIIPVDFRWKLNASKTKRNTEDTIRRPKKESISIREFMAYGFKRMIETKQVFLLFDQMQITHINSINYGLEVSNNAKDEGHGDIFWANAMLSLQETPSNRGSLVSKRKHDYLTKKYDDDDVVSRLKFYKKVGGVK